MSGDGPVRLLASQPKNVGLLFKPRFTNVSTSGTDGKTRSRQWLVSSMRDTITLTSAITDCGLTSLISCDQRQREWPVCCTALCWVRCIAIGGGVDRKYDIDVPDFMSDWKPAEQIRLTYLYG